MNAYEFIKEYGLEQAKYILKAVPPALEFYEETLMFHSERNSYFTFENGVQYAVLGNAYTIEMFGKSAYKLKESCFYLSDLRRIVESHQFIEKLGGLDRAIKEAEKQSVLGHVINEGLILSFIRDVESCR